MPNASVLKWGQMQLLVFENIFLISCKQNFFLQKIFCTWLHLKVNEERIIGLRRVFLEKRSTRRKYKKTSLTLKDDQFATFACYVVVAISSGRNSRKTNSRNIRQTNKPILKAERK